MTTLNAAPEAPSGAGELPVTAITGRLPSCYRLFACDAKFYPTCCYSKGLSCKTRLGDRRPCLILPVTREYQGGDLRCVDALAAVRAVGQGVLHHPPVLHNEDEIGPRIGDQLEVGDRIAVDQDEVGEPALL